MQKNKCCKVSPSNRMGLYAYVIMTKACDKCASKNQKKVTTKYCKWQTACFTQNSTASSYLFLTQQY